MVAVTTNDGFNSLVLNIPIIDNFQVEIQLQTSFASVIEASWFVVDGDSALPVVSSVATETATILSLPTKVVTLNLVVSGPEVINISHAPPVTHHASLAGLI